jgi:hypothetical protein
MRSSKSLVKSLFLKSVVTEEFKKGIQRNFDEDQTCYCPYYIHLNTHATHLNLVQRQYLVRDGLENCISR